MWLPMLKFGDHELSCAALRGAVGGVHQGGTQWLVVLMVGGSSSDVHKRRQVGGG